MTLKEQLELAKDAIDRLIVYKCKLSKNSKDEDVLLFIKVAEVHLLENFQGEFLLYGTYSEQINQLVVYYKQIIQSLENMIEVEKNHNDPVYGMMNFET